MQIDNMKRISFYFLIFLKNQEKTVLFHKRVLFIYGFMHILTQFQFVMCHNNDTLSSPKTWWP